MTVFYISEKFKIDVCSMNHHDFFSLLHTFQIYSAFAFLFFSLYLILKIYLLWFLRSAMSHSPQVLQNFARIVYDFIRFASFSRQTESKLILNFYYLPVEVLRIKRKTNQFLITKKFVPGMS